MANPYQSDGAPTDAPDEPEIFTMPRRRQQDADLDITPMIDVTFLLLIFFIVASRLDPSTMVDLPKAEHGGAIQEKHAVVLLVARDANNPKSALVFLGNSKNREHEVKGDTADQESKIAEYVQDGLTGSPPKQHVLIKAEKGIPYRYVEEVRRAASKAIEGQSMHVGILQQQ